jgi:hypothetical protein
MKRTFINGNLSMKQGNLFCFVLSPWNFPNHNASCCTFGIFGKLWGWIRVHELGFRLFGATMWKLLIIEPFFQWKINKIKLKFVLEFGGTLGVVGKHLTSQI